MNTAGVLWLLLLAPGSTVVVYLTFAAFARGVYELTAVAQHLAPRAATDRPGLRGLLSVWWRAHALLWRPRYRTRFLIGCLQLAAFVFTAAGMGAAVALIFLVLGDVAADLAGRTVATSGGPPRALLLGATLGVWSLGRAFSYIAQPDLVRRTGSMPKISLPPAEVAWAEAVRLTRGIYLYRQLSFLAAAAPTLVSLVIFASIVDPYTPPASDASVEDTDPRFYLFFVSFVISYGLLPLIRRLIDLLLPLWRAVLALEASRSAPAAAAAPKIYGGISDPQGDRRETVVTAAGALLTAARRVDSSSPVHPLASIMRAVALYLRRYVSSLDSLTDVVPGHLDDLLRRTVYVIAGPLQHNLYGQVAQTVSAFDANGAPNADLRALPPSRWVALASRAANLLEAHTRVLTALWGSFTLAVALYLIATGKLDLTKIQIQK